jgi:hypothetical protein
MKHKHCELIKAWADGHTIEHLHDGMWWKLPHPIWDNEACYRLHDPYRELKEAAADLTKQIRYNPPDSVGAEWRDAGHGWEWCFPPEEYEIRDKPVEKKKVKLLAWLANSELRWFSEGSRINYHDWVRVPSEDKEVEV